MTERVKSICMKLCMLVCVVAALIGISSNVTYSKYSSTNNYSETTQIAKMICMTNFSNELMVTETETGTNLSYSFVVSNFDGDLITKQVKAINDVNYKMQVKISLVNQGKNILYLNKNSLQVDYIEANTFEGLETAKEVDVSNQFTGTKSKNSNVWTFNSNHIVKPGVLRMYRFYINFDKKSRIYATETNNLDITVNAVQCA